MSCDESHWNGEKIVEAYRYRWTGMETFHRDGKWEWKIVSCEPEWETVSKQLLERPR